MQQIGNTTIGGRFQSYWNAATAILKAYDGTVPFAAYLKQHFTKHKKHGSKDRKYIAQLCYAFFRLGTALHELELAERILLGIYLTQSKAGEWEILFERFWLDNWDKDLHEKLKVVQQQFPSFNIADVFKWTNFLSEEIEAEKFCISHLIQPDLFIRSRPGKIAGVKRKLEQRHITYRQLNGDSIALEPTIKLEEFFKVDDEIVIQDYASQQVGDYFSLLKTQYPSVFQQQIKVWDCCAASGGKSILAKDILDNIHLTVSDIRTTILQNLKKRFAIAGIRDYTMLEADLTGKNELPKDKFQLIICDAPCSGSGTWGRTPEQLQYFKTADIAYYAALQKSIVSNALSRLDDNGFFLYITCSVFKDENEQMVNYITQQMQLKPIQSGIIKGYDHKADSMFAALFIAS